MKKIILVAIILLSLISIRVVGQNKNISQPELDSGTIEEKFDYIITKSSKFKDFQLIRLSSLLKVKDHTLDSIKTIRKDLIKANESAAKIKNTNGQLESEVQTLKNEIEAISVDIDSISVFERL